MDEGMKVVSLRRSDSCGLGFSILGGAGSELPPIIYDIIENSPASESGEVSVFTSYKSTLISPSDVSSPHIHLPSGFYIS